MRLGQDAGPDHRHPELIRHESPLADIPRRHMLRETDAMTRRRGSQAPFLQP
jgi:hypothetical protein